MSLLILSKGLVFYCIRHMPRTKDLPDELIEAFARYPETTSSK
jgi:hypothetical protein